MSNRYQFADNDFKYFKNYFSKNIKQAIKIQKYNSIFEIRCDIDDKVLDFVKEVHKGVKSRDKNKTQEQRYQIDLKSKKQALYSLIVVCLYSMAFFNKDSSLENQLNEVFAKLDYRLNQKGPGIYVSSHEALGILIEEQYEFREELLLKEEGADNKKDIIEELKDIAVGAIWGYLSLESKMMDW